MSEDHLQPVGHGGEEGAWGAGSPGVSVLLPVCNARRYLEAALASLWTQCFTDFEVVAIDDGSTDGSRELMREVAQREPRLRVIETDHAGVTVALNRGLAEARGPLLARMDADDVCEPARLARQVAYLADHPEVLAVGSGLTLIDEDGDRLEPHPYPPTHDKIMDRLLAGRSGLSHPAAMVRAEALRQVGGYDASYPVAQDFDLWLRLSEIGQLANLPDLLLRYRLHATSVGGRQRDDQLAAVARSLQAYRERNGLLPNVPADPVTDPTPTNPRRAPKAWQSRAGWARAALRGGEGATAVKHAGAVLRRRPWWIGGWVILGRARRGDRRAGGVASPE